MLVRPVVVYDQMNIQLGWNLMVDQLEELDPLLMPMPWHARADELAIRHAHCREQCGGAVTLVVVGQRPTPPGEHGQASLGSVEGLDLALLVGTQHQGVLWRVQVQSNHIDQLLDEMRVIAQLEGPDQVWLQAGSLPDAMHHGLRHAHFGRHRARTPVRGCHGRLLRGLLDNVRRHLLHLCGSAARARCVFLDAGQAPLREATAPAAHRVGRCVQSNSDGLVEHSLSRHQNNPRALYKPVRRAAPFRPTRQRRPFEIRQFNGRCDSHPLISSHQIRRMPSTQIRIIIIISESLH